MSTNLRKLLKASDPSESPKAATDQFIAAAKYQGLQPAEAVQLVDHDRLLDLSAINRWADARPVIINFFQERLSGGFPDE